MKVIIDAGHGGFDPGGGSNVYFKEKDKNLQISLYQNRRLNELGIKSVLVRSTDETLTPDERIARINALGAAPEDILISNHVNFGGAGGGEVIYSIRGTDVLPRMIANALSAAGLPIRNVYTRVGRTGRDFYFILRDTVCNNAMIIEYGFADVEADVERLLFHWQDLAEAVVKALTEYLQVPYTPPKDIIHVVRSGESLYTISQQYGVPVSQIKEENNLVSDVIFPGAQLIIRR